MLRFARYNAAGTSLLESVLRIAHFGARWALPGGIQKFQITIKAKSRADAFNRYRYHIGDRVAVFDDVFDRPIVEGWLYEGIMDGRFVTYTCEGMWARHFDEYETNNPSSGTDSGTYLKSTVLANHVLSGGLNTDGVITTGVNMGDAWHVDEIHGTRPGDIVKDILKIGDSSGDILDYFIVSDVLDGPLLSAPLAKLTARSNTEVPSWVIRRKHTSDLVMSRDAYDMRNYINIYYALATTLGASVSGGATSITVSSSTGFAVNDEIEIELDSGKTERNKIDTISGTTINLIDKVPGSGTVATLGNSVRRTQPLSSSVLRQDTTAQSSYWTRYYAEKRPELDGTQAAAYADAMLSALAYPANRVGPTVSAPHILDTYGRHRDPWRMLVNPGILRVEDLYAETALFDNTLDSLRSFRVIAMDYDYTNRNLRITPDSFTGEQRLDVLLQQAGIKVGQMIGA